MADRFQNAIPYFYYLWTMYWVYMINVAIKCGLDVDVVLGVFFCFLSQESLMINEFFCRLAVTHIDKWKLKSKYRYVANIQRQTWET